MKMTRIKLFGVAICITLFCLWLSSPVGKNRKKTSSMKNAVSDPLGYRYKPNAKSFNVSQKLLTYMRLPPSEFSDLTMDTLKQFVIVTGISSNHFIESMDAIASVQKHLPGKQIFYYDLGLADSQIQQVKSWCNTHYRKFNFMKYPNFVNRHLKTYAWKPLIVQELLREHVAVQWIDASFRFLTSNLTLLYEKVISSDGFVIFGKTSHSNFAVTHQGMYRYLNTDIEAQKRTPQYGSGGMFIVNNRNNYRHVLWWFYLCAVTKDCVNPGGTLHCNFNNRDGRYKVYVGCHRYDQSLVNVLLSNRWRFQDTVYTIDFSTKLFQYIRNPSKLYTLAVCKGNYVTRE